MNMIFISIFTTPQRGWKLDGPTKKWRVCAYTGDASAR